MIAAVLFVIAFVVTLGLIVRGVGLCAFGIHKWGPWLSKELHHTSKPEAKEQWAHLCKAQQRFCGRCGKNSPLTKTCQPIVKVLKAGVSNEAVVGRE